MLRTFVILPSLHAGGAERFSLHLLTHLDRNRFAPTLVLIKREGAFLREIPADVPVIDLGRKKASAAIVPLIRLIRREKPDVVFSTMGYLNIICAVVSCFVSSGIRFVAREASRPEKSHDREPARSIYRLLYSVFYKKFSAIVAQTVSQSSVLVHLFHVPENKITVIPNPVNITRPISRQNRTGFSENKIALLAAGSLRPVKGFDLLLHALALLPENFSLTIAGTGKAKTSLLLLMKELAVSGRVFLAGFIPDLSSPLAKADLFVLSSRYEGFPNVVLEALSLGTPVVAFSGDTAAAEIITDGFNGFLAAPEDPQDLAAKIKMAAAHQFNREAIRKDTEQRFGLQSIIRKYEAVLSG